VNSFKYPLILITPLVIIGILIGYYLQLKNFKYIFIFTPIILIGLFYSYNLSIKKATTHYKFVFFIFFILSFIISGLILSLRINKKNNPSHYSHYLSNQKNNLLIIEITEELNKTEKYSNYIADVYQTNHVKTKGEIIVKQKTNAPILQIGDRIWLLIDKKDISEFTRPKNPFAFDYKKYMNKKGIYEQIYLSENAHKKTHEAPLSGFNQTANKLRKKIETIFYKNGINGAEYQLASSIILGERRLLNKEITIDFQKAGTIHILAISGLHIGILLLFLNFIFLPIKRKFGKTIFLLLTLSALWFYAFLTGFSPSILRAVTMFSFIQTAYIINRDSNIYNTLFASALIMMIFNPAIVFEVGFQLSYMAVLGIVSFFPILSKGLSKWNYPWKYIGDLFLVSLSAQLGILPLSLYYFHQFPVFFLLANLIVIPLLTVILILGFSLIITGAIGIKLSVLWNLWNFLLHFLLQVNKQIAHLDYSLIAHISFDIFKLLLLYLIIFSLYKIIKSKNKAIPAILMLSLVVIFQIYILSNKWTGKEKSNLYFLHDYKRAVVALSKGEDIYLYTNDSMINPYLLKNFKQKYSDVHTEKMPFYLSFFGQNILNVDSLGIWNLKNIKPDIICLYQSPKINLDKVVEELQPKQIISLTSNYPSLIKKWKKTCDKHHIQFTDIHQNGAYILNKNKLPDYKEELSNIRGNRSDKE
jgi:competence protein ComEC